MVALSGGVDSSLLLDVARETLSGKVLAVTVNSPLNAAGELREAHRIADHLHAPLHILEMDILSVPEVSANPPDRCYYCKKEIFSAITRYASAQGITFILEGSNMDDTFDYRPGMRALEELKIRSPLKEALLTKEEIRSLARDRGLPNWQRPPAPCLATRIPHHTVITASDLKRVDRAEEIIHAMGIKDVRVRLHGDIARIEAHADDMPFFIDEKNSLTLSAELEKLGFRFITLDLRGYRRGSMNIKNNNEGENYG